MTSPFYRHGLDQRSSRVGNQFTMKRLASLLLLSVCSPILARDPISVAEAIETRRVMLNPQAVDRNNPQGAVSISPDGNRYVLRLLRGDVQRNGVWMEIYSGTTSSAAAKIEKVTELFTAGLGRGAFEFLGPDLNTSETFNPIRWIDNDRIAMLWSDEQEIPQAVSINVSERRVQWLTNHPTPVGSFDVSDSGVVLYNADTKDALRRNEDLLSRGFAIPEGADAYSLFRQDPFGGSAIDRRMNTEWFIADASTRKRHPIRIDVAGRSVDSTMMHRVTLSEDGTHAIVNSAPMELPDNWSYYEQRDMKDWIVEARRDPLAMMSRLVQQLYVVDVERRTSHPLWNAPSFGVITRTEWSSDGRHVVIAPAFLPVEGAGAEGLSGTAAAVVEVASGKVSLLPIALNAFEELASLRWVDAHRVELSRLVNGTVELYEFVREGDKWKRREARVRSGDRIRFEIKESLESPPVVVAASASGGSHTLLDPNPGLRDQFAWTKVKRVEGVLTDGTHWDGTLFYPLNHRSGRRYPLVIQSVYGPIASGFSLYGHGSLGPSEIAPYPGRLLANRDMFVLHQTVDVGERFGTPEEGQVRSAAFEAAIAQLTSTELIDPARVGLLGFSRNGYYVEYALTHSTFRYTAAIAADNFDPSYFPMTLNVDVINGAQMNGAMPFGGGLAMWLKHAPGFNADKVRTPLRKIEQSFGLFGALLKWEMFSRLRYLQRPVELYVMPDYDRGAHNTQNPRQVLAVQQGSIDWFEFWLNDVEDAAPEKASQYAAWRRLRLLSENQSKEALSPSRRSETSP